MIDARTPTRDEMLAQLLRWLPGVYRARDLESPDAGRLEAYLSLFADELWRLRRTAEQLYADRFIDSAQDWVIPYLAEQVGTTVLFTGEAARSRDIARRNRDDVKNTMHWRRQKGTLAGLQDVAHGVGGWGTHAAEMFARTAWMQNLTHVKRDATFALNLRDGEAVARALTPFSRERALADYRTTDQRVGWHQPRNLVVFEWPIASHALRGGTPRALGAGRYTFDALGHDTPLYASAETEAQRAALTSGAGAHGADIAHTNAFDIPLRTRDLRAHPSAYVGTPLGFTIREDGIPLVGGLASAAPSRAPAVDFASLARSRGLVSADPSLFGPAVQLEVEAVRLGAVLHVLTTGLTPIVYSAGQSFAAQLQALGAHGRLAIDMVTPAVTYTAGALPFDPTAGEFHHPVLLLRLTNVGAAAAALPEQEVIVRNARGVALQVVMPALASLAAGAQLYFYVADDGSTYFARVDHLPGVPDRNPDGSIFGAFAAPHLARASEGQRRVRPGHPSGAARFRRVVARDICCWDRPLVPALAAGDVAVDPRRGRIVFPAGEVPAGELTVDYRFGRTSAIGAGPFGRAEASPATLTVARSRDAEERTDGEIPFRLPRPHFATVQAAIDAAPNGGQAAVVIEILDSAVYEESVSIAGRNFPGGLVIQSSPLQTPVLRKPAGAAQLLRVTTTTCPLVTLHGLLLAGGAVEVDAAVDVLQLRACSLEPATVTLTVKHTAAAVVRVERSIVGALAVQAPGGTVTVEDSIVQHPAATIETPEGGTALDFANGAAWLERATLIGGAVARRARISNTLCYGAVQLADLDASCLRHSRLPRSLVAARAFRCTQATPVFVAIDFAHPGYCHLHPNTAAAITRGGEEGGEIGAFAGAGLPWRTQNTGLRLLENVPAALTPVQVRSLPRQGFRGNPPL